MRGSRIALAARVAAALLAALVLTITLDRDAEAQAPPEATGRILIPAASWHGRPIRAPHEHDTHQVRRTDGPPSGWSAGPVAYGAGFHRPGGSDRVREVQRRLARMGYRVGPIDGLFGRLTRASVAWFQVKHGLPVTGRATLATVRHLRARAGAPQGRDEARGKPAAARVGIADASEPAWAAFNQLVGPRVPVPEGRSRETGWPVGMWLLIALVAVDVLLLIGLQRQRRSGTVHTIVLGPPEPAAHDEPRPARRFAPPVPAPPDRPPDGVRAGRREGGHD